MAAKVKRGSVTRSRSGGEEGRAGEPSGRGGESSSGARCAVVLSVWWCRRFLCTPRGSVSATFAHLVAAVPPPPRLVHLGAGRRPHWLRAGSSDRRPAVRAASAEGRNAPGSGEAVEGRRGLARGDEGRLDGDQVLVSGVGAELGWDDGRVGGVGRKAASTSKRMPQRAGGRARRTRPSPSAPVVVVAITLRTTARAAWTAASYPCVKQSEDRQRVARISLRCARSLVSRPRPRLLVSLSSTALCPAQSCAG